MKTEGNSRTEAVAEAEAQISCWYARLSGAVHRFLFAIFVSVQKTKNNFCATFFADAVVDTVVIFMKRRSYLLREMRSVGMHNFQKTRAHINFLSLLLLFSSLSLLFSRKKNHSQVHITESYRLFITKSKCQRAAKGQNEWETDKKPTSSDNEWL